MLKYSSYILEMTCTISQPKKYKIKSSLPNRKKKERKKEEDHLQVDGKGFR